MIKIEGFDQVLALLRAGFVLRIAYCEGTSYRRLRLGPDGVPQITGGWENRGEDWRTEPREDWHTANPRTDRELAFAAGADVVYLCADDLRLFRASDA